MEGQQLQLHFVRRSQASPKVRRESILTLPTAIAIPTAVTGETELHVRAWAVIRIEVSNGVLTSLPGFGDRPE
jgi:hypothetical protein